VFSVVTAYGLYIDGYEKSRTKAAFCSKGSNKAIGT